MFNRSPKNSTITMYKLSHKPISIPIFVSWQHRILLLLSAYALFSSPLQTLRLIFTDSSIIPLYTSILFLLAITVIIVLFNEKINLLTHRISKPIAALPISAIIIFGLIIRLIWILAFPAQPGSDGAVYLKLSQSLISEADYEIAETKAYWPVGYPIFLAPWLSAIDDVKTAYLSANIFLYGLAILGIYKIASHLTSNKGGKLAVFIFAIWPNLVFNIATPEKEMLSFTLLVLLLWLIIKTFEAHDYRYFFIAGILMGFAILVQPSFQFLPILGIILFVIALGLKRSTLIKALLLFMGAAVVISPWTIRNYNYFHKFILVSTNGGDVFYRANNPLATGGYLQSGEINLDHLDEIERDKQGKILGLEWITSNPVNFIMLAFEKQSRFMGDDSVGVYNTLKVGKGSSSTAAYVFFKLLANLWWVLIWIILSSLVLESIRKNKTINFYSYLLILQWLYLFLIHSIFESAGKYHVPISWVICILIPVYIFSENSSIDSKQKKSIL